jgi:hypothetical protein
MGGIFPRELHVAGGELRFEGEHIDADRDHDQPEQRKKLGSVKLLAETCSSERAGHAGCGEHDRTRPFYRAEPRMTYQSPCGVERDGHGRGADGDMGRGDADEIDEKRYGENRASSSDEPERQPDDGARGEEKKDGNDPERHGARP